MDRLPIFPGLTRVTTYRPGTDGSTQNWPTGAQPTWHKIVYAGISNDQVKQVQEFIDGHKPLEWWRCESQEGVLENCYFLEGAPSEPLTYGAERYIVELVFQCAAS